MLEGNEPSSSPCRFTLRDSELIQEAQNADEMCRLRARPNTRFGDYSPTMFTRRECDDDLRTRSPGEHPTAVPYEGGADGAAAKEL